jgi:hypothetical protein
MVGRGSTGDSARAQKTPVGFGEQERRGLERCRRALERGRRIRGRRIAASERHGLLLDLRGAVGHAPASEAARAAGSGSVWRGGDAHFEGWVVAVQGDLVHLSARRPGAEGDEEPMRGAEVLSTSRSGAVVRLDDGAVGVLPWEELSWEPMLGMPDLPAGARLEGRIVALTLEGPMLSTRAAAPTPWPAIALALPPGSAVTAHVEKLAGDHALLRTDLAPRAPAVVPATALPAGTGPGGTVTATVARVNPIAGALVLEDLSPGPRAPRHGPEARRRGPQGPPQAASGSRS